MALLNEGGLPKPQPRVSPTVRDAMVATQAAARPVDGRAFGQDRGYGVYRGRGGQLTYKGTPPPTRPNPRPPGGATPPAASSPIAPPPVSSAPPLASTNPVAPQAPAQRPGPFPGTQMDASGFVSFVGGKATDPSLIPLVKAQNMSLVQRTGKNPYVASAKEVEDSWIYPKGYNLQSALTEVGYNRFGGQGWLNMQEQRRLGLLGAKGGRQYAATMAAAKSLLRRLKQQGRI